MSERLSPLLLGSLGLETLLAVGVVANVWVEVGNVWQAYPTWLYFGDFSLPTFVVLPTLLIATIAAVTFLSSRGRDRTDLGRPRALVYIAVIALLLIAYAVFDLNFASGGVFWAGIPALLAGFFLALATLLVHGLEVVRFGYRRLGA